MAVPGARPAELGELARVEDRLSFLYLDRCTVHRDANAITASGEKGTVHIPAAALGVLLFGPGTTVSHHAMMLIADSGSTAVWVGEQGVRYYAHGRGLSRNTRLLLAQADLVSKQKSRLGVARAMYAMRFPGEDISALTMQQLRGREGARVRRIYRDHSRRTGVPWSKREYDPENFDGGDAVNQALSAANSSLYGVVHSVIVALGCSPGLGFVHTGHSRSFVYDIADLYKAELTIPLAFDIAADLPLDIGGEARRRLRDELHGGAFLKRCTQDMQRLLLGEVPEIISTATVRAGAFEDEELDEVFLWDETAGEVEAGTSYGVEAERSER